MSLEDVFWMEKTLFDNTPATSHSEEGIKSFMEK